MSILAFFMVSPAYAATSQSLGAANNFRVLSSTYANTVAGTTLNGDLGYTTGPATPPTVTGTTQVANSVYNQAGIDQGNALAALNAQSCTFNFAPGAIDLASDTTHGPVGVYTPGVYCATGAASIGGGGTITLNGVGLYLFRMDGALTTTANSMVTVAGASPCDVWWTPTQATTLGANSTFSGSVIDASGITIGDMVTWTGQALSFGGAVSTSRDTVSDPGCPAARGATPAIPKSTPGLPNTGTGAPVTNTLEWGLAAGLIVTISALFMVRNKRHSI
jgi:hypothetical protein